MLQGLISDAETRRRLLKAFAMGTFNYWFAFVADFSTAAFFLGWELTHGVHLWQACAAFTLGFILWGFTEYGFHRWIYHQPEGIFGEGHHIHHIDTKQLIGMPWFITTATMLSLWYCVTVRGGVPGFASVVAGWLVGFVWYSLVHHSHHHWAIRSSWSRKLKAYHRVHHQFPDRNYGVTMRLWDLVFGTRYRKPTATVRSEEQLESLTSVGQE